MVDIIAICDLLKTESRHTACYIENGNQNGNKSGGEPASGCDKMTIMFCYVIFMGWGWGWRGRMQASGSYGSPHVSGVTSITGGAISECGVQVLS